MYDNVIYNVNMFKRDKFYDYKKFCERIVQVRSKCHPPPPPVYPFLKERQKKKQMESEKKYEINFTKDLLIKKYKSMYKNHNKYHPSNLIFKPHPSSLYFSTGRPEYYELCNNNNYLGKKLLQIQSAKGRYNCSNSLKHYGEMRQIGDRLEKSCKYYNQCLDLITPHTYEKRLHRLLTGRSTKGSRKFNGLNGKGNKNKKNNLNLNMEDENKEFMFNDVGGGVGYCYGPECSGRPERKNRGYSNTEKNFYVPKDQNYGEYNNNLNNYGGFHSGNDGDDNRKDNNYSFERKSLSGNSSNVNNLKSNKKRIVIERENINEA